LYYICIGTEPKYVVSKKKKPTIPFLQQFFSGKKWTIKKQHISCKYIRVISILYYYNLFGSFLLTSAKPIVTLTHNKGTVILCGTAWKV
jgi:hypothetical protein